MRFEQALQAMREGKIVKINDNPYDLFIKDNELYQKYKEDIDICDNIGAKFIMSEDWEIEEDEPQS